MVMVYADQCTSRLLYSCRLLLEELLQLPFTVTDNRETYLQHSGVCINYSASRIRNDEMQISPVPLLFESGITEQPLQCFTVHGFTAFFEREACSYPFDIFAAAFYLVSRYEEYLPHEKDEYGRYPHVQSLAYREGFLQQPLVNIWAADFGGSLSKLAGNASEMETENNTLQKNRFRFIPTYDIDIAYSFRGKGWLRNTGGWLKKPSLQRLRVLLGKEKDPFDCYSWLDELHCKHKLDPVYFFLVPEKNGSYEKNILPEKTVMQQLIKDVSGKYKTGIHPSWQSSERESLVRTELQTLQQLSGKNITASRQHYIRMEFPNTYRLLINKGISDDFSMGYGSVNGFRASVAGSFNWFDLPANRETELRIHPFCFMDANSYYEQHFSPAQAMAELQHYYDVCKSVNGTLITIWHNNFLGTDPAFAGWKDVYEKFLSLVAG